jgi:hypothetical protein
MDSSADVKLVPKVLGTESTGDPNLPKIPDGIREIEGI